MKEIKKHIKGECLVSDLKEYGVWCAMKHRCNNLTFRDYGGRGIKVCDEWQKSFWAFYEYMGPRPSSKHTVDRINNDGNYEPGNVKWSTMKEQCNNRRPFKPRGTHKEKPYQPNKSFQDRLLEINGEKKLMSEWVRFYKISRFTVYARMKKGIDLITALTTPTMKYGKRQKSVGVHKTHTATYYA